MSSPAIPAGTKVLTVSELTQDVKVLLEEGFSSVWVGGEVSSLARPSSGHLYFNLKDAQSCLRTVMWRSSAMRLRFEMRDGLEVIARGKLSLYQPRGDCQLYIEELHPKGLGAAELALRQLREKLFKLGWFDPRRKRPLPRFPRRVGVVTSPTGAAIRDILEVLGRRWRGVEVWVCPVRVQGDGSAVEVAAGLALLNRLHQCGHLPLDVLILGRGGGSVEDLWTFNDEGVARAIFESLIPVVSAVGHEIDVTIADLVADLRALTPTDAATRVVPDGREVLQYLSDLEGRLRDGLLQRLDSWRRRLDDLAARRIFRLPLERLREAEQRLDDWSGRLNRAARQRLKQAGERLQAQAGRLESLSPLNVLARGYSLTRVKDSPTIVRHPSQVQPGDLLETIVQHGQIVSRVEETGPRTS